MKRMSIFVIKDCFNCPLSEYIDPYIVCKSAAQVIGSYQEVEKGTSIPEWCPLEDYKENKNE
jgi:hypothetical protein